MDGAEPADFNSEYTRQLLGRSAAHRSWLSRNLRRLAVGCGVLAIGLCVACLGVVFLPRGPQQEHPALPHPQPGWVPEPVSESRLLTREGGRAVAVSPDGTLVAVGGAQAVLVEFDSGVERARLDMSKAVEEGEIVRELAFSPDGALIAIVGLESRALHLWNTATGEAKLVTPRLKRGFDYMFGSGSKGLAFRPDGGLVAILDGNRSAPARSRLWVALWDVALRQPRGTVPLPEGRVEWIGFSADGRTLAAYYPPSTNGFQQEALVFVDVVSGQQVGCPFGRDDRARQLGVYSPDGRRFARRIVKPSVGSQLQIWDASDGYILAESTITPNHWHPHLQFSRDGRRLAYRPENPGKAPGIVVVDVSTGQLVKRLTGIHDGFGHDTFALTPNGSAVVIPNAVPSETRVFPVDPP